MEELFKEWVEADNAVHEIGEKIGLLEAELNRAKAAATEAMIKVRDMMNHDGLVEDTVHGALVDYKIYFTTPKESVKVLDANAVPDELCKIERKPMLREIGKLISEGATPNWAVVEIGTPKLIYKAITRR